MSIMELSSAVLMSFGYQLLKNKEIDILEDEARTVSLDE